MTELFVVEALRWGDRENHSYVVGVFANIHDACEACVVEELWRGGKYKCVINDCNKMDMGVDIQAQKEELLDERDVEDFTVEVLGRVIRYMELHGMTGTEEYEKVSEDWQDLAQDRVTANIFGNDAV